MHINGTKVKYMYTAHDYWEKKIIIEIPLTLETYSNSANLKAIPKELKRTETREQASQNGFKRRSKLQPLDFTVAESSSNASATADRGVDSPLAFSNESSSSIETLVLVTSFLLLQKSTTQTHKTTMTKFQENF